MLYETPRYRVAGERHLLIELSETVSLETNFSAIALAQALTDSSTLGVTGIRAIVDAIPSFTTVLVQYDPHILTAHGLKALANHCLAELGDLAAWSTPSRLIEIPVAYNDRWCRACFDQYCQTVKPIEDNLELVCRLNQLDCVEDLIAHHSTPEWWVGAVGFIAGLPTMMPLDPAFQLQAPKYDPPRTWTPKGTVGIGGGFSTIYPIVIPDGYQMIGRTPVPIFEPQQRHPPFDQGPLLFRVGDRVKFKPISEAEFEAIEQSVALGEYKFHISPPTNFSLQQQLPQIPLPTDRVAANL
ncbi:allophanate hydrolase subunit 1 [filamentous cyanobacterium LEGE 11480]|uniref:Allophanate hydrolase subunit 1 n=1 Tax=Romeriopsis navalis LEGE 11480 TaxID=2777977 RepID=A0A928VNM7_9CYAN|nr:allophanate hydrolase subunit 1 [Romeriopsis navalis]MBE9031851.1 allophanate hydrolase subunit 1 [Romeriopsis navalis LEGE 11480]